MMLSQMKRVVRTVRSGHTAASHCLKTTTDLNTAVPGRLFGSGVTSTNVSSGQNTYHPWIIQSSLPCQHSFKSGVQIPSAVIDPLGITSKIPMIRQPPGFPASEYRSPGIISRKILEDPSLYPLTPTAIEEAPSVSTSIEKQAARLIVIRRSKMNKHKLKKLRKKMKYVWAKVKQRREMRREKEYLNSKMALIQAAKQFDAKEYVAGVIRKAKEEPIPKRWQDPLMPQWYKDQEMLKEIRTKRYQKLINLHLNHPIKIDKN